MHVALVSDFLPRTIMHPALFILLAVIANMALGAIWFSPKVFGSMWMKDAQVATPDDPKQAMIIAMTVSAISHAVIAVVLWGVQYILAFAELRYFLTGIILIWIAFVFGLRLIHALFEGRSMRYVGITTLHDLAALLIAGSIVYYAA